MDGLTQRRGYDATLFLIALLFGLAIAWMDARPHWDDTGVTVGCLVLSAGLHGIGRAATALVVGAGDWGAGFRCIWFWRGSPRTR